MGYIKLSGIVIRESNTGEGDKILTILARNKGKITGYAKGARRNKSNLLAGTQLMAYSDFVLYKGREFYSISSCDVVEPFYDIRNDIIKLTYAAHILEVIQDATVENQPSNKSLKLLLNSLHVLSKGSRSPELILRIFELRLMSLIGYSPHVMDCLSCRAEKLDTIYFSHRLGGFLCQSCRINDKASGLISQGAAKAIHHIIHSEIDNLFNFDLSEDVLNEVSHVSKRFLKDKMERDYHKLEFLKKL